MIVSPNSPENKRGEKAVKRVASRMAMLKEDCMIRTARGGFLGEAEVVVVIMSVIVPYFGLNGQVA